MYPATNTFAVSCPRNLAPTKGKEGWWLGLRFSFCHLVERAEIKLSERKTRFSLVAFWGLEPITFATFIWCQNTESTPTNYYNKDRPPAPGPILCEADSKMGYRMRMLMGLRCASPPIPWQCVSFPINTQYKNSKQKIHRKEYKNQINKHMRRSSRSRVCTGIQF